MKIQPGGAYRNRQDCDGTAFFSLVMLLVFALLDRLDVTVVLGTLWVQARRSSTVFLMALSVQRAAESMNGVAVPPEPLDEKRRSRSGRSTAASRPEVQRAKRWMQLSYTGRMLLLVGVAIVALTAPCFHPVAAALALLFSAPGDLFAGICQAKEQGGLNADET